MPSSRTTPPPNRRRWRRLGQLTAATLMILGVIAISVPVTSAASANPTNPLEAARAFNVMTRSDAFLGANESEGPIAIGGDLSFDGYNISIHDPGTYKVDPSDPYPTSLLVGGRIDFAASAGEVRVLDGWLGVRDPAGATAHQVNSTMVSVNESADAAATPRVVVQGDPQPADTVFRQHSLNIESIFAQFDELSAGLKRCAPNVHLSPAGRPQDTWQPNGSDRYPHLSGYQPGQRVLTLSAEDLAGMDGINFAEGADPTASSPLVINVTDVPDPWVVPVVGSEQTHSPFILWNFGDIDEINITGQTWRALNGTVLAPKATLENTSNGNMNGGVFVDQLRHVGVTGNEEIHYYPLQGLIEPCDDPAPPTSTPTTTEPETPTTTEPETPTTTEPETTTTTDPETPTTTDPEPSEPEVDDITEVAAAPQVRPGAASPSSATSKATSAAGSLARTGDETTRAATLGVTMLLGGTVLLALATRPRRN